MGEGQRGGQRRNVVHGELTGARSASSTNPQPDALPHFVDPGAMTEDEFARKGQAFKDRAVAEAVWQFVYMRYPAMWGRPPQASSV